MLDEAFQNSAEKEKETTQEPKTPHSIVYRRDCESWWWWLVLRGEHLLARGRVKVRDVPLYIMYQWQVAKSANPLSRSDHYSHLDRYMYRAHT